MLIAMKFAEVDFIYYETRSLIIVSIRRNRHHTIAVSRVFIVVNSETKTRVEIFFSFGNGSLLELHCYFMAIGLTVNQWGHWIFIGFDKESSDIAGPMRTTNISITVHC